MKEYTFSHQGRCCVILATNEDHAKALLQARTNFYAECELISVVAVLGNAEVIFNNILPF